MTSTFSEPPRDFGANDAPASRYTKQLAALEQRCQSASKDIQSWRLMTFGMTGLAVAAMAACLYVASLQPTPAVHVVEIDGKTGETICHQVIGEPIQVSDAMVSHMIAPSRRSGDHHYSRQLGQSARSSVCTRRACDQWRCLPLSEPEQSSSRAHRSPTIR